MNANRVKRTGLVAFVLIVSICEVAVAGTGFRRIGNEKILFALSQDGRSFELGFTGEPATLKGDRGLFDMMVGFEKRREAGIAPAEQVADVTSDGNVIVARYEKIRFAGQEHAVEVELRFAIEGESVSCEARIENKSRSAIVVWNSSARPQAFNPTLNASLKFLEGATISGAFNPGDLLPPNSVAVLVYIRP